MGLPISLGESAQAQSDVKEVRITVRAGLPVPEQFHFDVWAENGKIKIAHYRTDPGSVVPIEMDDSEIKIGCTTITLQAFEIIRERWEQHRKALKGSTKIDREYDRQIEYLKKRVEELERHVKV